MKRNAEEAFLYSQIIIEFFYFIDIWKIVFLKSPSDPQRRKRRKKEREKEERKECRKEGRKGGKKEGKKEGRKGGKQADPSSLVSLPLPQPSSSPTHLVLHTCRQTAPGTPRAHQVPRLFNTFPGSPETRSQESWILPGTARPCKIRGPVVLSPHLL